MTSQNPTLVYPVTKTSVTSLTIIDNFTLDMTSH